MDTQGCCQHAATAVHVLLKAHHPVALISSKHSNSTTKHPSLCTSHETIAGHTHQGLINRTSTSVHIRSAWREDTGHKHRTRRARICAVPPCAHEHTGACQTPAAAGCQGSAEPGCCSNSGQVEQGQCICWYNARSCVHIHVPSTLNTSIIRCIWAINNVNRPCHRLSCW